MAQAGSPSWHALVSEGVDATVAEAMADDAARAELERMLDDGKLLQIADHCKDELWPVATRSSLPNGPRVLGVRYRRFITSR